MVLGEQRDAVQGEESSLSSMQRLLADVGGVEDSAVFESLLAKKDHQGIEFLACAAAGNPHFERGISPQMRHDLLSDRKEIPGIPKHLADLYREVPQNQRQHRRFMQEALLHGGEVGKSQLLARLPEAPLGRRHRVVAKIVVIPRVKRLEEEADLNVFDLF